VFEKIIDKLSWIIAYLCLPVTYPIHYFRMKALDKKVAKERKEREAQLKR
tara:strand:+ start:2968 stop:3117 length:150 start_codon:yes stop_codon:yes gene_type:complete